MNDIAGYRYTSSKLNHSHQYLLLPLMAILEKFGQPLAHKRIFELGCGNGAVANHLTENGWNITGVDPSIEGISLANSNFPHLTLMQGASTEQLALKFGQFPVVLSLEVVEHVYSPREFARTLFDLCENGGQAIVSTPYHGYLKNLALAITGKMDSHFTALWDNGHIKFWSIKTLEALLQEAGFKDIKFKRVGRIAAFAKSMIATAKKP